jgi:predicted GTPase
MWWLIIPALAVVASAIYDDTTEEDEAPLQSKTILELNIQRLKGLLYIYDSMQKVAIIGQPGAGKSSLLKKMTNGKAIPMPVIGTHTDATNWANDHECDLLSQYENFVFADVPGYDTLSHPLDVFLSSFPFTRFDAFIFVVHGKLLSSDEKIFRLIVKSGKQLCVVRSFSDSIESEDCLSVENDIRKQLRLEDSIPIKFFSNRTGEGIEPIFNAICP